MSHATILSRSREASLALRYLFFYSDSIMRLDIVVLFNLGPFLDDDFQWIGELNMDKCDVWSMPAIIP